MIETTTEQVTPEMAEAYLSKNPANRPLSPTTVTAFAEDMRLGLWRPTHQGIAFDQEGNLLDGQHRCAAVIQAGVTVTMQVSRNVPRQYMNVLDAGRKRTAADSLAIAGYRYTAVMASIARIGILYDAKDLSPKHMRSVSGPQVHDYSVQHAQALTAASARAMQWRPQIPTTTAISGSSFFLFNRVDPEATEQFFNAILHMRTNGEGDPRLALIRRLNSQRANREKLTALQGVDFFIRAWNAWREGVEMDKLPLAKSVVWREVR